MMENIVANVNAVIEKKMAKIQMSKENSQKQIFEECATDPSVC